MDSTYRDILATVTFVNDADTLSKVQALTDQIAAEYMAKVPEMDWLFFYVPQPKVIQSYSKARGGNVLGLDGVGHDQISMSKPSLPFSRNY